MPTAGFVIYNGDNFPPEYRGRPLFFNIHGRSINQENLVPEGSGYVAKHLPDFLKTNDPWFTGVALKVGPDGAVYFIDWYDPQKCHKTDPLVWDRGNGRIYRVKYESTWKPWKGDLTTRTNGELLNYAGKFNWQSRVARQILAWGKKKPQSQEDKGMLQKTLDFALLRYEGSSPRERNFLPKFWTVISANLISPKDFSYNIPRANSLPFLVYPRYGANLIRHLADHQALNLISNEEWRLHAGVSVNIRLALASALQRLPPADRWDIAEALIQHGEDATDHNLPQMYWYAIEPLVPADPARALDLAGKSKIPLVAQNIARRTAAVEGGTGYLVTALAQEKKAAGAIYLLKAAMEGWRGRDGAPAPDGWDAAFGNIDNILKNDAGSKPLAAEITDLREALAVAFGDRRAFPRLRGIVQDTSRPLRPPPACVANAAPGQGRGSPGTATALLADSAMRLTAIRSLPGLSAAPEVLAKPAAALLTQYASLSPVEKQAAIATLSARADWAGMLLDAIADQRIPRADLTSFAARQIVNFGSAALIEKLTKAWGSISAEGGDTAAEAAKLKAVLTPEFLRTANLPAGRALFAASCGTCHPLFGQGALLGPDLTGSNRADLDYLLENILNPNALIGKDYELHLITLKDGRSLAGMVREETAADLTVQSLTGSDTVAKKEIAKHETPGLSMMPPGQLTVFTKEQQRDLIAYLASPSQVPLPGEPGAENFVVANRIPGALEGEGLTATPSGGNATPQPMDAFRRGNWNWSSGSQLWWTGGKPGDRLDLVLPVLAPGTYEVQIVLTKAPDYANLKFLLDGKPLGGPSMASVLPEPGWCIPPC